MTRVSLSGNVPYFVRCVTKNIVLHRLDLVAMTITLHSFGLLKYKTSAFEIWSIIRMEERHLNWTLMRRVLVINYLRDKWPKSLT